jgi:hypothetical protein
MAKGSPALMQHIRHGALADFLVARGDGQRAACWHLSAAAHIALVGVQGAANKSTIAGSQSRGEIGDGRGSHTKG